MSLNHIKLTPRLLAEMYGNVLVESASSNSTSLPPSPAPTSSKSPEAQKSSTQLRFLGNNTKKVLIIVKNDALPFLDDASLNQLTSILSACGLSLADVAIVNWAHISVASSNFVFETLDDPRVLLFGISPLEFGLPADFPAYQVQNLAGRTYIAAPALAELIHDKEAKKMLWTSLKKMFGI